MSSDPRDVNLVRLMRAVAQSVVAEAAARTRVPGMLSGNVEDVDEDLDVVWVRMDLEAQGSDPAQSDNYEAPGIIPTSRLGSTFVDERVRVTFNPKAGADAMQTSVESRIVLPFGTEAGHYIVLDGEAGTITFYGGDDAVRVVQLDPVGGIRLFDAVSGALTGVFDSTPTVQLRNPVSGAVQASVDLGKVRLVNEDGSETIELGQVPAISLPKAAGLVEVTPGTTFGTPAADGFGSNDLEIRYVAGWHNQADLSAATFTPPAGFTERLDAVQYLASAGQSSLAVAGATRQPATPGSVQTFTCSTSLFNRATGLTVVVHGAATPTAFRSISSAFDSWVSPGVRSVPPVAKPPGVVAGEVLVAFVTFGADGGGVPTSWTTPPGWQFITAQVTLAGTGAAQTTLATGVWAKIATGSEPSDYTVTVQTGGSSHPKQLHASIFAIQNALSGSPVFDIQINDRAIGRGIVAQQIRTTNSTPLSASGVSDMAVSDVPVIAGHTYAIHLHSQYDLDANGVWLVQCRLNGSTIDQFWRVEDTVAGGAPGEIDGTVYWTAPTTQETDDFDVFLTEVSGASSITLNGAATTRRTLTVTDLGVL